MSRYAIGFAIGCAIIFALSIIAHVRSVRLEKWDQSSDELVKYKEDALKKVILYVTLLIFVPMMIPIVVFFIGKIIPLITLIVVFFVVCFSALIISQGHRLYLIRKELKARGA